MTSNNDLKPAEETYAGFIGWLKTASIITAIVTAFVVFLIAT